jgi:hypothetical protein
MYLSVRGEAAVDRQADADHETRARAAQSQHSRSDLLRSAEPADRLLLYDLGHSLTARPSKAEQFTHFDSHTTH